MAAVTLLQELSLEQPKLRKGVIKTYVEVSPFGSRVPMETTGALSVPVTYLSGIPTAALRFINEASVTQSASFSQLMETLAIFDSDIDIDPVLLANKNQVQRLDAAQSEAKIKAIAYDFVHYAVNGDPVSGNAREPYGMKYRLNSDTRFNGQSVNATANATEGEARVGTATDANYRMLFHRLNELIMRVGGGMGEKDVSCFLTNSQVVLTLWAAAQQLKVFDTTKDSLGRTIQQYRGIPILDAGFQAAGALDGTMAAAGSAGNQVIGNDSESCATTNGANAYTNQSPIYAVKFGDNYYLGLQQEAMKVKPYGETETSPHYFRTNIRWVIHPAAMFQKRAAARLVGFAVSVAPA